MQNIPSDYCGKLFSMNPETEDIVRGNELKDGMVVLVEPRDLRFPIDSECSGNSRITFPQIVDVNRWCYVTKLHSGFPTNDRISFVGIYSDGTKAFREYQSGTPWFVKIDSIPVEESTNAGIQELLDQSRCSCLETEGCIGSNGHPGLCQIPDNSSEDEQLHPSDYPVSDDKIDNYEESMPQWERDLLNVCLKTDGCVLGVDHDGICTTPVDLVKDMVNMPNPKLDEDDMKKD